MQAYDCVVFDLDGTLVDTEPLHFAVTQALLAEAHRELTAAEFERFIGHTTQAMWVELAARFDLPEPPETYVAAHAAALLERLTEPLEPAPGAVALVRALHARGVPLGIASSSLHRWVVATLSAAGLGQYFDAIVGADDVERGKPAPDPYLAATAALHADPTRCLAFEDSAAGIASAKAAGLRVVAVRTPYTARDASLMADVVVASLAEVDRAALGLSSRAATRSP